MRFTAMTSDDDLRQIASFLGIPIPTICNKDQLHHLEGVPMKYFIVNMQNSTEGPGTHWVCFIVDQTAKTATYHDSFGMPPPIEIREFLARNGVSDVIFSTKQIQPTTRGFCGEFCLRFLKHMQMFGGSSSKKIHDAYASYLRLYKPVVRK